MALWWSWRQKRAALWKAKWRSLSAAISERSRQSLCRGFFKVSHVNDLRNFPPNDLRELNKLNNLLHPFTLIPDDNNSRRFLQVEHASSKSWVSVFHDNVLQYLHTYIFISYCSHVLCTCMTYNIQYHVANRSAKIKGRKKPMNVRILFCIGPVDIVIMAGGCLAESVDLYSMVSWLIHRLLPSFNFMMTSRSIFAIWCCTLKTVPSACTFW